MQPNGSVSPLIAGLVHPLMRHAPLLRLRHQDFIAGKLGFVMLALAGAPVFVALRGVPTPGEAAIFALALVQLVAAMLAIRGGSLGQAQSVATAGFAGIGCVAALLPALGPGCAAGWFLAAAAEAMAAEGARLRRVARACVAAALAVAAMSLAGPLPLAGGLVLIVAALPLLDATWRACRLRDAAAAALSILEARGGVLAAVADAAVVEVDAAGLVAHITANASTLLGVTPAALQGRGLFEHIQVADRPAYLKLVSDAAHEDDVRSALLRFRCDHPSAAADGGSRLTPDSAAPPRPASPQPCFVVLEMRAKRDGAGVVALLRDASAASRAETLRDEARQLVGEAVRSRDELLATVSHELRTPLNAVIGFSEVLASNSLRPTDEGRRQDYSRIILRSAQHLLSVVDSVLDMSSIRPGTAVLLPERFDVALLVGQCLDMMQMKAEAGAVTLRKDVAADIGSFTGDRRACRQILLNLLSDAVTFTPNDGEVTVVARLKGTTLLLAVSDTGVGVAAADIGKLGQPFVRAGEAHRRSERGTDLAVVRGLVDLHGGDLAIFSEVGRGTTVEVRLPLRGLAGDLLHDEARYPNADARIHDDPHGDATRQDAPVPGAPARDGSTLDEQYHDGRAPDRQVPDAPAPAADNVARLPARRTQHHRMKRRA